MALRLLLVHQNFPGQFRDLAPALQAAGHEITAIGCRDPVAIPAGIAYHRYGLPDRSGPAWAAFEQLDGDELVAPLLRAERVAELAAGLAQQGYRPDAVLFHSAWGEGLFLRGLWPGCPLIAYPEIYGTPATLGYGVDGSLPAQAPPPVVRALQRQNVLTLAAIADSDCQIVPTRFQRDSFPAHLRDRLRVIPEGVDLERVAPDPHQQLRLADDLVLRPGDPVVTLVNRQLEPLRGFRTFMRALPALLQAHPTVRILIVGGHQQSYGPPSAHAEGYWGDMLAELGHRLDLSRIHRLGRVPYPLLLAVLQVSAAHVYLTYPHFLSWSLLEAMACGAAVVGSAGAPVDEVIRDGRNGLLVPFNDSAALAAALLELLRRPQLRQQLGAAARRTMADHYDLGRSLQAYSDLLGELSCSGLP